jgi:hypothetical protein
MRWAFSRSRFSWVSILGIVCIALVLMSGLIQAAHFHASGQPDHDCALCVAAHHAVRGTPAVALLVSSSAVARLIAPSSIHHPRRAVFFRLASRPPPADPFLA